MLQGTIIRGTTPTHEFDLPYPVELVRNIRITYGQKNTPLFTKTTSDCSITEGKISVSLTEEETFSIVPGRELYIEIRIKLVDGKVVRSEEPIILRVVDTMDNEVMS